MKVSNPKTESWFGWWEGDVARPIDRKGRHLYYYKKKFWKRYGRKKYLRKMKKLMTDETKH